MKKPVRVRKLVFNCIQCRFYEPLLEPKEWGICRRHAPRAEFVPKDDRPEITVVWPAVRSDAWCGEGESPSPAPSYRRAVHNAR